MIYYHESLCTSIYFIFFTDTDNIKSDFKKQRKFFRRKKILPLVTKPPKLQQYVNQKVIKSSKPNIFNTTKSMESLFPKLKNEKNVKGIFHYSSLLFEHNAVACNTFFCWRHHPATDPGIRRDGHRD